MVNISLDKPTLYLKKLLGFRFLGCNNEGVPDTNYDPEPFSRPVSVRLLVSDDDRQK
jgi:hypothetical protein